MTLFAVLASLMVIAGVAVLARPLLGTSATGNRFAPRWSLAVAALVLMGGVAAIYPTASNWHWKDAEAAAASRRDAADPFIERLEKRVADDPDDIDAWLLLGRGYVTRQRLYRGADAFEQALARSNGENADAMLGLGEALAMADQNELNGRAGQLLDRAAALQPTNPRALWWGGAAAYQRNDLATARDRWQKFLATNPPPEIAQILKAKIAEIERQAGTQAPAAAPGASVRVKVDLAPALRPAQGVLFVLAKHANEAGPPLAVKRLSPGPWPIEVELSEADAMMPGRTLKANEEVQVIARISASGTPIASPGDRFGEIRYRVGHDGLTALTIDKTVQ